MSCEAWVSEEEVSCNDQKSSASPERQSSAQASTHLDQTALDIDTPLLSDSLDDLLDLLCDALSVLNHALQIARTNNVSERSLSPLDQGGSDVADTVDCSIWVRDGPEEDRLDLDGQVVSSDDALRWDIGELNLDIDSLDGLGARVDGSETRVDGLVELSEARDEADGTLLDLVEGVWAAEAAWNLTKESRDGTNAIHQRSVEAVLDIFESEILGVGWLHLILSQRLYLDETSLSVVSWMRLLVWLWWRSIVGLQEVVADVFRRYPIGRGVAVALVSAIFEHSRRWAGRHDVLVRAVEGSGFDSIRFDSISAE